MTDDAAVRLPPERWREVFAAADRALALSTPERVAFIDQCSRDDPALGLELEGLLARGEATSALDKPAATFAEPLLDSVPSEIDQVASRIGPYRIVGLIGRGGMGAVYLAERADDQYRKRVALKLLPSWSAADEHRVRRFVEERQILAALEHPDIARLLDGGVMPDGLPWFAMEYVEGTPIDRYCDEHELPIERRLELFCRVCVAVEYAHRNLVVHRDLKPANILVTADGAVKLLDFGIAKLLNGDAASHTELTQTHERFMTPLFASPEQVRGETVSTASDVYALGVLLYGLLAGRSPYRITTPQPHEVARAILEQEPELPSAAVLRAPSGDKITRRLRGDLDAIVLKAMEKDRRRRYASVEQLEADVRRYLARIPVAARPATRVYRAQKFFGRHKIGIAVGAGIATITIGLIAVLIVLSVRIVREAKRTDAAVTQLTNVYKNAASSAVSGRLLTRKLVLDSASASVERAVLDPGTRARLLLGLGQAYATLGQRERARALLTQSVELARSDREQRATLASALAARGELLTGSQDLQAAERDYQEALALRRRTFGERNNEVAQTLNGLASVRMAQHRVAEAESLSRRALAIDSVQSGDNRSGIVTSLRGLGRAHLAQRDYARAANDFSAAVSVLGSQRRPDSLVVAATVLELATALKGMGDSAADRLLRDGLELRLRAAAASSSALPTEIAWLRTLQTPRAPIREADVSFDSRIVFVSGRGIADGGTAALGTHEIYLMNPDGSGRRQLTHSGGLINTGAISADGTQIAYTVRPPQTSGIFVQGINGGVPRQVMPEADLKVGAMAPSWSPDGTQLAFNDGDNREIYLINLDGTGLRNLTRNSGARNLRPVWSPKGDKIAFLSDRDGGFDVYVMNVDGTNAVRLTSNAGAVFRSSRPAWSPDASKIAFAGSSDGNGGIYVVNADGSGLTKVSDSKNDVHPTWSPDGTRIAYTNPVDGHLQIFMMKVDGSGKHQVTESSGTLFNGFPEWATAPRASSFAGTVKRPP